MKKKKNKDKNQEKIDKAFQRKIKNTFENAGFSYFKTQNIHQKIGNRTIELDAVFLYKNIILICEDTGATNDIKGHIRNKKEVFEEIRKNSPLFLKWLCKNFPEKAEKLKEYPAERFSIFNLYFSQNELQLDSETRKLYRNIKFISPKTLDYFKKTSDCIKRSSRFELFRFLDINPEDIGVSKSDSDLKRIKAPIICSKGSIGATDGIRVVSFMMSADLLLETAYVLRKDNWEDPNWAYQRLVDKKKISNIRQFLASNGQAFYNNIIVGLPNTIRFENENQDHVSIDEIDDLENCKLLIPKDWNSVCIIDGQHRLFAHHEGLETDEIENEIAKLRKKLHLLVTGLIFPKDMTKSIIAQKQSQIFLEINSNSKAVPADVLLHIKMISKPFSDIGIARRVIEKLNEKGVFENLFELTSIDKSKIKVASIIKFALRYLVTLTPAEGKKSFFSYFDTEKQINLRTEKNDEVLAEYIKFCSTHLQIYFGAINDKFKDYWSSKDSKLLSVTSINGFIMAYTQQLSANGLKDFDFYKEKLKTFDVDFKKKNFPYTSSQYGKFSIRILKEVFNLEIDSK